MIKIYNVILFMLKALGIEGDMPKFKNVYNQERGKTDLMKKKVQSKKPMIKSLRMRLILYTQLTSIDFCRKNKGSGKNNKNIKQNLKN